MVDDSSRVDCSPVVNLDHAHNPFQRMKPLIQAPWLTLMHPDLRVTYHRGVFLFAKSLMEALTAVEPTYRLLTDAVHTGDASADMLGLIKDIEQPRKLKIRALQMLPRYLSIARSQTVEAALWPAPGVGELGDRSAFLQTTGGLLNVEQVYEVCRLASSKPFVPPFPMDFLHTQGSDVVLTTAPCAIRSGRGDVRIIQTIHDLFLYDVPSSDSNGRKFRRKIRACLAHADLLLTISEYSRQLILQHHPEAESRLRVIYPPIPADEPTIAQSAHETVQADVLARFGIKPKGFILYVGAVEARKNIACLIRAHQRSKHASQVPLVIAGLVEPGYLESSGLKPVPGPAGFARIPTGGSGKADTIFLGRVSELEKLVLLRNASLFAFPTLVEGFGIPVLEAQSFGCPVVASSGSTMPEVLGDTAVLVDEIQDPQALGAALDDVMSRPEFAKHLSDVGLHNSKRFSKKIFAESLRDLIAECRALPQVQRRR
jgi:glycosyltransferase involved in cell wall biosynthesis